VSGNTSFLSKERLDFEKIMPNWQAEVAGVNKENIDSALNKAEANVIKMISLLDALIVVTSTADNSETLLGLPVSSYSGALLADRATLNTTISAIQNARFGLSSAKEAVTRAEIGGTSSEVSLANAQVKIALGSLRAAQAAYEKTLIRTPITGVVNALYLKAGEYVSPGTEAAIVANNNGLEISTSISQEDREGLSVGDVVTIESKTSGVISAIAGAIDPSTGKVAIKVGVDDNSTLENGSTVSILFDKKDVTEITEVRIPLSAIKMTGNGPIVFTVNSETNVLFALAVVLGPISGDSVVVSEGVALDTLIVVDARGLKEGQIVTVKTK
jgi:RND family efflux transporter MFP subunit